jgi:hypothetical protein
MSGGSCAVRLKAPESIPAIFTVASIIFSSWPKSSAHSSPSHRTVMPLCIEIR